MKKSAIIVLAVLAVLLLAGAAYVAANLIGQKPQAGQVLSSSTQASGAKKKGLYINVIPAAELPKPQPDLVGKLVERKDNSLWVIPDSKSVSSQDIPQVEIVVTNTTKVFHDITKDSMPPNPDPNTTYQQKLEPFTIDQLLPGDQVIAFGDLRGSRLVAAVVVVNLAGR